MISVVVVSPNGSMPLAAVAAVDQLSIQKWVPGLLPIQPGDRVCRRFDPPLASHYLPTQAVMKGTTTLLSSVMMMPVHSRPTFTKLVRATPIT